MKFIILNFSTVYLTLRFTILRKKNGSEPQKRGSEPGRRGSEPGRRGSEPEQRGSEPGRRGSEPEQRGSELQKWECNWCVLFVYYLSSHG